VLLGCRTPDAAGMCKVDGSGRSEAEVAEVGVIVGTAAQGPMKAALGLADWRIVDAGETAAHQAVFAKLPILVPVGAEPGAAVVVPLIRKAHGDAVLAEAPQLLDEPIVELALPLAGQEGDDLLPAPQEFGTVSPVAIDGVGECDLFGIAAVPPILGEADLFNRRFGRERWQRGR
jgi:hypothetical protein